MSPHLALRGTAKFKTGLGRGLVSTLGGQETSLISMGRRRPLSHTLAPMRGSHQDPSPTCNQQATCPALLGKTQLSH